MSGQLLRFPDGNVVAPEPPTNKLRENAREWLRIGLEHELKASDAINVGDDAMAICELVHARNKFDRAVNVLMELRGRDEDARRTQLEALKLILVAVAGELDVLPAGIPALTAHRLDIQIDRVDNVQSRLTSLATEYRAIASAALEDS